MTKIRIGNISYGRSQNAMERRRRAASCHGWATITRRATFGPSCTSLARETFFRPARASDVCDPTGSFRWFQPHQMSIVAASAVYDLTLACMLWRKDRDAPCHAILQTVIGRASLPHWACWQRWEQVLEVGCLQCVPYHGIR
jgi:hypothetical protein